MGTQEAELSYRLPDVIGIGTRRCGSSWLHKVLSSHPEIGKPDNGLHYFSNHRKQPLIWYNKQLAPYADRRLLLEFSVSYTYPEYYEAAAQRMYEAVPGAKLFVCVRNPVARAYSDFLRSVRVTEIDSADSFEKSIEAHPELLDRSRYARLIEPFIDCFSAERVKVLFYDDLNNDPIAYAAGLAAYLGVAPVFDPDVVGRAEPKGKTVRSDRLNRTIRGVKAAIDGTAQRLGLNDQWSDWKGRYVYLYESALEISYQKSSLDQRLARRLAGEFKKDVLFLERLTGRDLGGWNGA